MNITSKSRYALKIMMDLAATDEGGELSHRADIAGRQGIPIDYMDQILLRLRDANLIASTRGRAGGYRLARPAAEISTLAIFRAVEEAFEPVSCLEGGAGACTVHHLCGAKDAWSEISHAIHQTLSGILLSELASEQAAKDKHAVPPARGARALMQPLQECRAPARRAGGVSK